VTQFVVRPASADDAKALAELFAAVAQERDGIATEPPVDVDERAALFARSFADSVVAVADGQVIGMLHVEVTRHGFGEIAMLVDRGWRGRGVGSALMRAAIGLARERRLHKLCRTTRRASPCTASAVSSRKAGALGSTGGRAESCGTRS
jgi:L-amino acid N-acyltransferase YncA